MSAARARGFSLVELLVTLAILAIVSSYAVSSYRQYVRRAHRVDATATLLRLSAAQEKYYAQNGRYADNDELSTAPPAGLGIPGTEHGYYLLDIALDEGGAAQGYRASATVDTSAAQADDADCWSFSINQQSARTAHTRSGDSSREITQRCWR